MRDYSKLGLYEHNIRSYEKVIEQFENDNIAAIVHATGTGKSFNALQLALDNKNKKILYIVPYGSIIEHEKELIEQNNNISLEDDFPNLEFRTYQSFINMSEDEIAELDVDLLILDEFHHIGAPIWGARINTLIETHNDLQIFGMTAYTVRDRGTSYERDMVNSETDELFSNKVVSNYDLCDAMVDGVLPKPIYKSGYVYLNKTVSLLEEKVEKLSHESNDYKELMPILKNMKKRIHEAPSIKDIFKKNIKKDGKYIYFCPMNSEEGRNDIDTISLEAKKWLEEMGLTEENYEFYTSVSTMQDSGKSERKAFYSDKNLNGEDVSKKLRIMFAINQYNEGVHAPGLDGVIMGRETQSDIIFFEQLGRALSVRGKTKEDYAELESKSIDELLEICSKREIKVKEGEDKREIIEKILAPLIIDLANNIGFMKDLENNLKDRIKQIQSSTSNEKRVIYLGNASFDIDMINEDLFEELKIISKRLSMSWFDYYILAKEYFKHYGNLKIPYSFKTLDGINYDENGFTLGVWVTTQRQYIRNNEGKELVNYHKKLLDEIGMSWDSLEELWMQSYEIAKKYYECYGNLKVPYRFKTLDGINHDENGFALGVWVANQRQFYKKMDNKNLTDNHKELLNEIGMVYYTFETQWAETYELAKIYYEHYGNLEIPRSFKTINGYEYFKDGVALGNWISTQRQMVKGNKNSKLSEEQINLLKEIGFVLNPNEDQWNKFYDLAKKYYLNYGNLNVPRTFKTLDGINYDDNGMKLGIWVSRHRYIKNGNKGIKLSDEKKHLLEEIGITWDVYEEQWTKMYDLAKKYYEHYGNLIVQSRFKTLDGINYDENGIALGTWIDNKRRKQKTGKLTTEQIRQLEQIGMVWSILEDNWFQFYELAKKYYEHYGNLQIPDYFKTINGYEYSEDGLSLGTWISTQRRVYNNQAKGNLTDDRINLLEQIGISWKFLEDKWNSAYELAKNFYQHHGNLEVPYNFKTSDGINYDEKGINLGAWITNIRRAYVEKEKVTLTDERIKMLNEIGMIWIKKEKNNELLKETITEDNKIRKQTEVLNRARTLLNEYDDSFLPSKSEINDRFMDRLDIKSK